MSEITKEQFMINELAGKIAVLEAALAEKEFFIKALEQKLNEKEDENGKEE